MMLSRLRDRSLHLLMRTPPLLPSACAVCGLPASEALCTGCRAQFFGARRHRCARCALPLPDLHMRECGACLDTPPAFDATIAAADYAPPVDQLVLALKFGSRLALAPLLAQMLRDAMLHESSHALPQLLTAVPLGTRRLSERGFNQAIEIARPLARALGIAFDPRVVLRSRDTQAQSLLHPDQRRKNIRRAFIVPDAVAARVDGRHIAVVDDVITTGETLNEVAATLKRAGAARITNLVFARTLQK